ncbi:MAG: carbohydrate ABC transporter permease [Faecalibacterium sp.]|jgi:multiple sugar transport system permease protein|nr:carbohydrate ABC transporter permease [Faecalibacterium sp.]
MAETKLRVNAEKPSVGLVLRRIFSYFVLILLTVMCLFWFYLLFVNSTRSHAAISLGFSVLPGNRLLTNLKNALATEDIPILRGMLNSLIVAGGSAFLSVYFSALTAYAVHVYSFRLKKFAYYFILMIMMIPTQVSALGFLRMITKMHLMNSLIPLIVPTIAAPMTFFFLIQYMEGGLPLEVVEAARIDGSGEFATFNRIVLPIMKPACAVQAIFTFVANWNNYFIPNLLLSNKEVKTLPVMIYMLRSADFLKFDMAKVYMTITIAILPVIIVYLLLSKYIVRGVALGSVKG